MTVTWSVAEPSQRCPSHVLELGRHQRFWPWTSPYRLPRLGPTTPSLTSGRSTALFMTANPRCTGYARGAVIATKTFAYPKVRKLKTHGENTSAFGRDRATSGPESKFFVFTRLIP